MNNITFTEISQQAGTLLKEHGYSPEYREDGGFDCSINGVAFSFQPLEDELFWCAALFELEREMTDSEKDQMAELYLQIDTDDVAFENLHIDGKEACLSSAFPVEWYEPELIELAVKLLQSKDGIVPALKARQIS